MSRYTKVVAGLGAVAGALGISAFNWSFDVSDVPEVSANVLAPQFSYSCVHSEVALPLDQQGEFSVSVWNIYKQQKENWREALAQFSAHSQLVLLQEASLTPGLKDYLDDTEWKVRMANAFKFLNTPAGVMNLSSVNAKTTCAYLAMEPWLRLPKSALLSEFVLSDGQTLAVVNLHGVNFALGLEEYKEQFNTLKKVLDKHIGPIILAGDFNTWRQARVEVVEHFAQSLGLKDVVLERDRRIKVFGKPLDHLYYRGVRLVNAEAPVTDASDHNLIIARFRLQ
ncbi:endonuclease/exonuclease/phosphatase family protein [Photobacterium ganghwense]|uniref:endonuclease/exonuclease/phosphatase family protein n=1 Tax=Photobacterium ganghwense TaxID=320778 RepID=UPI001C2DB4DC|nr:endonuclease/exonuclease/phosphatase family protein [Photobacterium ganghwense]MBV1840132.1 endonuclease/exonuclease/phosphatase family protein [Photobacterium ganghwense]